MSSSIYIKSIVLATLLSVTSAWSFAGHMVIARIAEILLTQKDKATYNHVLDTLKTLEDDFPALVKSEKDHPFVESAIFADQIKYEGGGYQSPWHFFDKPYLDQGGKISDYDYQIPDSNVTNALKAIVSWFKQEGDYKNNQYYKGIHGDWPSGASEADATSIAMRLLVHYVGDSHQPLHSETRVDKNYEHGDRGGNDFPLPSHYYCKNLHCVWDRVVYEFKKNPKTPFTSDGFDSFDEEVQALMKKHPVSSLNDVTDLDPTHWETESFAIVEFAYRGISENTPLSDEYIKEGQIHAEKQLVTAGHRLANLLMSLHLSQEPNKEALFLQK